MVADCVRPLFLVAVSRLAPLVLESLRDDVLPVYQQTWRAVDAGQDLEFQRKKVDLANQGGGQPADEVRAPSSYRRLDFTRDLTKDRPLYTEEEARELFKLGYELLGVAAPGQYFLWHLPGVEVVGQGAPNRYLVDFDDLAYYPSLADLRSALVVWAKGCHLAEEWVLDVALTQLDAWDRHPHHRHPFRRWPRRDGESEGPSALEWLTLPSVGWASPVSTEDRLLTFEHRGWDPAMEKRGAARKYILADFVRHLEVYLEATEARMTKDWEPWQLTPEYRALPEHLKWFVRYQVLRQPWPEIAATADRELANGRRVPVSADFVARRVKALAAFIELPLDPVRRPGRPIGRKTENTTQNRVTRARRATEGCSS